MGETSMEEAESEETIAMLSSNQIPQHQNTLKSKTKGGLITMPSIIVNEAFEKVASYGLLPNLIFYLMNVYHLEAANGSIILSLWSAASNFMAIFGAVLSDSYLGRFRVIALGTLASLLGTTLLWSTSIFAWMRPPPCTKTDLDCNSATPLQYLVLFSSFGLISIGAGCVRPCSIAFGADQFYNKENPDNERVLDSFFNWYYGSTGLSSIIALTVVVYIQDQFGWQIGFGVPVCLMVISLAAFLLGSSLYVHVKPKESLFTSLVQVPIAAFRKRKFSLPPSDVAERYFCENNSKITFPSENLRCLNSACIIGDPARELNPDGSALNPWILCPVERIETVKAIVRLIPISTSGIMLLVAMNHSYTTLQAKTMNRHLTSGFEIPAGVMIMMASSRFLLHQVTHNNNITPSSHLDLRYTCGTNLRTPPPKHTSLPTLKNQNRVNNTFRFKSDTESTHFADLSKIMVHAELRDEFLAVLRSRRSHRVPLTVEQAKPVTNPMYQDNPPPSFSEAMESCPKVDVENFRELLVEENLYLYTEASEQGRLPVLILSMKQTSNAKRPAIVFLHSTHKCKEWLRPLLEAYASRGYVAIAIDSRYHGERASSLTTYREALVSSWKKGDTMPFIFDTVWDLIKLGDYLTQQRDDIDSARIGITGESLGGMHAWFAAFVDTRYAVVVPIIGVQGFRWAIDNDKWQARVDSIKAVFEEARIDLGKSVIDKDVVEKVWDRINPGLASQFDAPHTVPAIAPRPLLILNGEEDPRCPLPGLDIPKSKAETSYKAHNADCFKLIAEPGVGHQMTSTMVREASIWFDCFLQ